MRYLAAVVTTMLRVVKLNGCSGRINQLYVDGGDYQLELQGPLDLDISDSTFVNAGSFNCRFVAVTSGRVRFASSRLQFSGNGCVNFQTVGSTVDVLFDNTDLLDPLYGAAVAGYGCYFSTTGRVRMVGGRLGRTTNIAAATAWAALTPYIEGDMRSDAAVNYVAMQAHTSSAAGAGGNEPGVGATWQNYWRKHVANVNAYLYLDQVAGTFSIDGTELLDSTVLLRHAASTQVIKSQRWANKITGTSANKGDASGASTQFTDPETSLYATALTANRTHTFNWIAGVPDRQRVVRSGLGAFNLDVGPGLKTITGAVAGFVEAEWDGPTARLSNYGLN